MNKIIPYLEFITKMPVIYSFFAGVGLYHAIHREKNILEIPLSILVPVPYFGYKFYEKIQKSANEIATEIINDYINEIKNDAKNEVKLEIKK
jgi:hypothetical protein